MGIFGLPSGLLRPDTGEPPAYRWDNPALESFSGMVRILDSSGTVRYRGWITQGAYTGKGQVFDRQGMLVYEGPLSDGLYEGPDGCLYQDGSLIYQGGFLAGQYEGQGRRTRPSDGLVSEGTFSGGSLNGKGRELAENGTVLLREGTFSQDLLSGSGKEYRPDGRLLREGSFTDGLLDGQGTVYAADGSIQYEGAFRRGVYHGQGVLFQNGAPIYSGAFRDGLAVGFGQVFHPSGQVLYTGQVYDAKPRADAFLGLSIAEVESAFSEHWQLYSCEEKTGFVYPTFGLIFVTDCPVTFRSASAEAADVVPPVQTDMAESDSAAIPAVFPGTVIAQDGGKERPMPPQPETPEGETLSPDTVHSDLVICEVLSYREPLPGTVQPPANAGRTGTHASGWREWFSACARGEALEGIQTEKTGTFVIRFRPQTMRPSVPVGEVTAEGGGIRTTTVYYEGKEQPLWYQSAVRTEAAQS